MSPDAPDASPLTETGSLNGRKILIISHEDEISILTGSLLRQHNVLVENCSEIPNIENEDEHFDVIVYVVTNQSAEEIAELRFIESWHIPVIIISLMTKYSLSAEIETLGIPVVNSLRIIKELLPAIVDQIKME